MKTGLSIVLLALVLTQAGCKTDPTTTLVASFGAGSSSSAVAIAVASSLESGGQIPIEDQFEKESTK
jgi:3-hydroxy-3-methylglutaryl CoA synthase